MPELPWPAPPGGGRTEPAARVPVAASLATGARTAPLSPAQARATTMAPPVTAAQLPTPARCACQAVRDRIRFQARSSAPRRIGSSMNRHDSAAIPTLAATCRAARGRFSVELAGEVRMITG